jgi:hypothetical protein
MSPEFLAILEEGKQLGRWFVLLPICLGLLGLYFSAVKSRKIVAFLYITVLALSSVVIPTLMAGVLWSDLTEVGTSDEELTWIHNHDGGLLIGPFKAMVLSLIFWVLSVLVLSVRAVIAVIHKAKEKREKY